MLRVITLITLLLLLNCLAVPAQSQTPGTILFQKSYENYAWEATFSGILVDSDGKVFSFNFPAEALGPKPVIVKPETAADLKAYYARYTRLLKTVDAAELAQMVALIPEVAAASSGPLLDNARDAGQKLWLAYQVDNDTGVFKTIKLREDGDSVQESLSPKAVTLINWLNGLK
ncbi:MAG: hypothetical protein GX569_13540 [Candidatus Riflebacteria bacterium]|nr:hypothetical protein [Candidatus Riflebacteria bacterium]